jgi:hypothetical protein
MKGREQSQAALLVELAESVELFTTPGGEPYGRVRVNEHWETWPLRSRGFRQWLARGFYISQGKTAHSQAMQDALSTIEGMALYDGDEAEVYTRVGADGDELYLDLADELWQAVRVSREGWEVVGEPAVRFRRSAGMLPLPVPAAGGDLEQLREELNVTDDDWRLLVGWLIGALRARGPYPVLCLHGEQGSAKSTTASMLRALVDPNQAMLRSEPRESRDLMVSAQNSWVLAYDNVSKLPYWLSDGLCRLATGGGYATRMLYTDSEEVIFSAQRPIMLTGIEDVATRGDLLDRAIVCYLPRITNYRAEDELWQRFSEVRPALLGRLLDAVACALRHEHEVRLDRTPRMADFGIWVTAAEPELGWEQGSFLISYDHKRGETHELALESSPIAQAVRDLVEHKEFCGTATELLEKLNLIAGEERTRRFDWPKSPTKLSGALRRIAPNLRPFGIDIEFEQTIGRNRRGILIRNLPDQASHASQQSQPPPLQTDDRDAATPATQETDDVRGARAAAMSRPITVLGDDGYLELLDHARAGGFVTEEERRQRRLLHLKIRGAAAA